MTRKRSLLLVSLFLALATSAFAQTQWTVGSTQYSGGRQQGYAEAIGPVSFSNYTAGTVSSGNYVDIVYTVPIWNLGSVYLECTGGAPSPFTGGGGGTDCSNYLQASLPGPNTIRIKFIAQAVFPTPVNSTIFVFARGNLTGATCGTNVTAVATSHTVGLLGFSLTPNNPSNLQQVLTINCDPALIVGNPPLVSGTGFGVYCSHPDATRCEVSDTAYVLLCLGVVKDNRQYERYFTVNVAEAFANALTSESYEEFLDPGSSSPGYVTNPTSITVVLSNIPTNFGISAGDPQSCVSVTAPGIPCAGGTLDVGQSGSTSYWNSTPGNSGTVTFEYPVEYEDSGVPENVNLPFKFYSAGPLGTGNLPCITMIVMKNPDFSSAGAAQASGDIPAFETKPENAPLKVICFDNCETNLLFPFIINYAAWDTDIAISNTTLDPLALAAACEANPGSCGDGITPPQANPPGNGALAHGTATPQSGVCWVYYYSGGALASTWVTPNIVAGSTYTTDLGYNGQIPGTSVGYIWAKCFFSQAYGYAGINYSFTSSNGILADYLAINIPDPEWSPRDRNGDGMGENSDTPFNISRHIQDLIRGWH